MTTVSVVVDSRDRDRTVYPTSQAYVVRLHDELKDVVNAELRQAIYAPVASGTGGGYACLIVEELRPAQIATNSRVRESCALLHLDRAILDHQTFAVQCPVVSSRVSKFTVRFVDPNGDPIDLGEHLLRFDVRTRPRSRDPEPGGGDGDSIPKREPDLEPWARSLLGIQGAFTKSALNRAFHRANDGSEAPKIAYKALRELLR